jgi:hypothetical protein
MFNNEPYCLTGINYCKAEPNKCHGHGETCVNIEDGAVCMATKQKDGTSRRRRGITCDNFRCFTTKKDMKAKCVIDNDGEPTCVEVEDAP